MGIFQLRIGLSPLLEHNVHKFLDTPSNKRVICNLSENTEHLFLFCIRFVELRQLLFNSIQALNANLENLTPRDKTKLLLYGDDSLYCTSNKRLFKATLKFILDSERFS